MQTESAQKEVVIIPAHRHGFACDGGGALGHPRVYYTFDGKETVTCRYCDKVFRQAQEPHGG